MNNKHQIRITGILLKEDSILLVKQKVNKNRQWSLPGGRLENNETMEQAAIRELKEETGLDVGIKELLYICEKPEENLLHITFLLEYKKGIIQLPTNEHDENPISDVKYVPINKLNSLGFSNIFIQLINDGFPKKGSYMGLKKNIGL